MLLYSLLYWVLVSEALTIISSNTGRRVPLAEIWTKPSQHVKFSPSRLHPQARERTPVHHVTLLVTSPPAGNLSPAWDPQSTLDPPPGMHFIVFQTNTD